MTRCQSCDELRKRWKRWNGRLVCKWCLLLPAEKLEQAIWERDRIMEGVK